MQNAAVRERGTESDAAMPPVSSSQVVPSAKIAINGGVYAVACKVCTHAHGLRRHDSQHDLQKRYTEAGFEGVMRLPGASSMTPSSSQRRKRRLKLPGSRTWL